jgi:hypothetical protein
MTIAEFYEAWAKALDEANKIDPPQYSVTIIPPSDTDKAQRLSPKFVIEFWTKPQS